MGFKHKHYKDINFTCTAYERKSTTSCLTTICANGECNKRNVSPVYGWCTCDAGWQNGSHPLLQCDECCSLECQNGGLCMIDSADGGRFCNCVKRGYTGPLCEEIIPTTTLDWRALGITEPGFWNETTTSAICIMLLFSVVFIILIIAIPYVLYKRRHILIIKIIYKFRKFEDDDSRKYDVFLSYRTSNTIDRKFVIYQLLPAIENMGFTACIDERDFIPGAAIAETIKIAIQESRRSILVVSPAYIQGEWPEFEVQCALTETLKKSHRVIPIIFKPIDESKDKISPTLSHLLESITYIEWPQDETDKKAISEFWRRLQLSLPKKKETCKNTEAVSQKPISPEDKVTRTEGGFLMSAV